MKLQLQQFLLFSLAFFGRAQHIEPPLETDVDSPDYCKTNQDGFGGQSITNEGYEESTYFYELTVKGQDLPEDAVDTMIFEVEQRIADFLLSETNYFAICADRRRVKSISNPNLRRLQGSEAIAITINPRDEMLVGGKSFLSYTFGNRFPSLKLFFLVECTESTVNAGETCIVVDGAYRVYFAEGAVDTISTMESMEADVEAGMDDGQFTGGNIVQVTWLDDSDGSEANGGESGGVSAADNSNGSSTPAIVGASVGGILAIGLIAFYRRRNMKADDDTLTTPPGGSNA